MKKITTPNEPAHHIAVFQETTIRRVWHNEEWWFAIVDVVGVLTDSVQPEGYVKDLRRRDPELAKGWGQIATPLRVTTAGGAQRVNCANTEGLFRIIQSIPSPKAEPFKRWLAQVGYERVKEIENPELASARARDLYQAKGYPQAWIEKRLRSIAVRGELTDEWKAPTKAAADNGDLHRLDPRRLVEVDSGLRRACLSEAGRGLRSQTRPSVAMTRSA